MVVVDTYSHSKIHLHENFLALLGAVLGMDTEEALSLFDLNRRVKLPRKYIEDRDQKIMDMRAKGLPWYQIGRALGMDAKTAQKAYRRLVEAQS